MARRGEGRVDGRASFAPASRARRAARSRASSDATDDVPEATDDAPSAREAARRLLPSFLAARRGSRFAHQEFVSRCARATRAEGLTISGARVEAALMGLSAEARMGQSEQDAFASATAMVALTLRRFDGTGGEGGSWTDEEDDPEVRGMLKYIEMTNKNADEGYTLRRMELERRFLNAESATRRPTPGEAIMRMNCKLTLLTREMIEHERGITNARKSLAAMNDPDVSADENEIIEIEARQQLALAWCTRERTPARALASDMLVAFFSVLTSHPVGYRSFVRAAREAYESGISADEITAALDAPEFDVEGTRRGMFGRAADAPKLFAGFVTTAFVAFEAEGLPLPAAAGGDENLFAHARHPRASDEIDDAPNDADSDEKRRAITRGLRQAVEVWLQMDRDQLASEVNASLSLDEGDDNIAKRTFEGSSAPPGEDSFAFVRDDAFGASSITLATLRHQRNIVSFVRNELANSSRC